MLFCFTCLVLSIYFSLTEPLPDEKPAPLTESATSSISQLQNPQTFNLGQGRQRITKADFMNPNAGLKSQAKCDDPFSTLDPMWSLTNKTWSLIIFFYNWYLLTIRIMSASQMKLLFLYSCYLCFSVSWIWENKIIWLYKATCSLLMHQVLSCNYKYTIIYLACTHSALIPSIYRVILHFISRALSGPLCNNITAKYMCILHWMNSVTATELHF